MLSATLPNGWNTQLPPSLQACVAGPSNPTPSYPSIQKCVKCNFTGPLDSFPQRRTTSRGPTLLCHSCCDKDRPKRHDRTERMTRQKEDGSEPSSIMSLDEFLDLLSGYQNSTYSIDTFIELPPDVQLAPTEQEKRPGTEGLFGLANAVRNLIAPATQYRWR